ncbi:MerR family transcriptional regulator [Actinocorallia longicatena]|uniref:HTH merR-type domain-containing protein n=1 Tax=Actinocorallia longicatena TaxID=111803 RepID=A0ABP6QK20_9ACTN
MAEPVDEESWTVNGPIYSPRAAAESVDVRARTLRAWANEGLVRHVVISGRYLLHAEDVDLLHTLRLDHGVSPRELRLVLIQRAAQQRSRGEASPTPEA